MKILVTGGCGFIGSNFVRYWSDKHSGDSITVLDKLTYAGHLANLKGVDFEFKEGDICDSNFVAECMGGVDVVVHFAAESHVDRSIVGPEIFTKTNVLGTHTLLEEALKQKIKHFHHVSTDEVFGSLPLDRPELRFNEDSWYNPSSPYSASKAGSDHIVRAYYRTYNLPVTITNTSNNYGPYQDPEKLIPRFITNLIEDRKVPLMGNGENVRDWCYVGDHCRAIETVIEAGSTNPKVFGETFCVGGSEEKTNMEVTMELLKIFEKDKSYIETIPHRLGHDSRYAIDSTKIRNMLGWKPIGRMEYLLKKTAEWYIENKWWWEPLKKEGSGQDPDAQSTRLMQRK